MRSVKTNVIINVITYYTAFLLLLIGLSFFKSFFPPAYDKLVFGCFGLLAAFVATTIFLQRDKKSYEQIGIHITITEFKNFLMGSVLGIVLMALVTLIIIIGSGLKLESNPNSGLWNFIWWSLSLIPLALMEEIPARGYALFSLKEEFSIRTSILTTSLLFVIAHIAYGWSITASLLGPGIMGIIFGTLAVYSKGIALPTGVHFGFNCLTSAFGNGYHSHNLWIIKAPNNGDWSSYTPGFWANYGPNVFFLIVGIMLMEIVVYNLKK